MSKNTDSDSIEGACDDAFLSVLSTPVQLPVSPEPRGGGGVNGQSRGRQNGRRMSGSSCNSSSSNEPPGPLGPLQGVSPSDIIL